MFKPIGYECLKQNMHKLNEIDGCDYNQSYSLENIHGWKMEVRWHDDVFIKYTLFSISVMFSLVILREAHTVYIIKIYIFGKLINHTFAKLK